MGACVGACVRSACFSTIEGKLLGDFQKNFTSEPDRDALDLIRFWPYKVNALRNGGAIYGEICLLSIISEQQTGQSPPKFYQ